MPFPGRLDDNDRRLLRRALLTNKSTGRYRFLALEQLVVGGIWDERAIDYYFAIPRQHYGALGRDCMKIGLVTPGSEAHGRPDLDRSGVLQRRNCQAKRIAPITGLINNQHPAIQYLSRRLTKYCRCISYRGGVISSAHQNGVEITAKHGSDDRARNDPSGGHPYHDVGVIDSRDFKGEAS